jgi:hypothetical protein
MDLRAVFGGDCGHKILSFLGGKSKPPLSNGDRRRLDLSFFPAFFRVGEQEIGPT